jgi:hypothetical protein
MLQSEFEQLRQVRAVPTTLSVEDVAGPDRTLIYGYDLDRTTVHVYLKGGLLHCVRYRSDRQIVSHESGEALEAERLRPSKRAYPARTDYAAAVAMAKIDCALSFTTFEEVPVGEDGYYGVLAA